MLWILEDIELSTHPHLTTVVWLITVIIIIIIIQEQALALLDRSISETRQDSHKPIFSFAEDDSDETSKSTNQHTMV